MAISVLIRGLFRAAKAYDMQISRGDTSLLIDECALLCSFVNKNLPGTGKQTVLKTYKERAIYSSIFRLVKQLVIEERVSWQQKQDVLVDEELLWKRGLTLLQFLHQRVYSLQQLVFESHNEAVSQGIRVESCSKYLGECILPELGKHSFSYYIRLTNVEHAEPLAVVRRYWYVADIHGRKSYLKSLGIPQRNPILKKGQSFEYEGQTMIDTKKGTIYGSFEVLGRYSLSLFTAKMPPLGLRGTHIIAPIDAY
eukprot:jgi/Galph1/4924/GphlegSOOS_G3533.1